MQNQDEIFKSLSDKTRRNIFEQLCLNGQSNVKQLSILNHISQPAITKHLKILENAGLINQMKNGRETLIIPKPENLKTINDWSNKMNNFWEVRFNLLEDLVKRID